MTKKAFTVDTGLFPNHDGVDLGHTEGQFRDVHVEREIAIGEGGKISINGTDKVTETGGSVSPATAIAYSIALG